MIDRKTALVCAVLIALMLVAAVARIIFLGDWPMPSHLLRQLFLLPVSAALLPVSLYANGRRAIAADAKIQPWYHWGNRLAIGACASILLIQGLLILQSLGLQVPDTIGYAIAFVFAIAGLLAINQMPKLPWFERRFYPGGELGPIYGPKYLRAHSRVSVVYWLVMQACIFALPNHLSLSLILATAILLVWTMALQLYYRRKWKLDQSMAPWVKPEGGR